MNLWNNVCKIIQGYKHQNLPENKIEELWKTILMELGWSMINGELKTQVEIPIGANNKLRLDILLNVDNKNALVVELKRPNQILIDKHSSQLISYMLQMRMKVGILICNELQIFYDDPTNDEKPQKLLSIDFVENNQKGIDFFNLLTRSNFSEQRVQQYCESLLNERKDDEEAGKIVKELLSNNKIRNDFNDFLYNKYGEKIAKRLIESIDITVRQKKPDPGPGPEPMIGALAKSFFGKWITEERFSSSEIQALCDERYSRLNFSSGYPILREITDANYNTVRYDHKGRARYWRDDFYGYGKKFCISSQWYESQREQLISYFNRLGLDTLSHSVKHTFNIDGKTYKIVLEPDHMSKYPHLIDLSTGYIAKNQKGTCREFLKPYGFDVPMDADIFLTHDSIKLVHKV
jgi:hypothetical protein